MFRRHKRAQPEDLAEQRLASEQANARLARREAARRYGGFDPVASFGGALAAVGSVVLLGSIAASIGWIRYSPTRHHSQIQLSAAGVLAGALTLFVGFVLGGWVAGRMARYDGGRNGLLTVAWFVALVALAAAVGGLANRDYNALTAVQAPRWLSENAWTARGLLVIAGAIVVMLLAASLGGRLGQRYHRKPDAVIAATGARHEIDPDIDLRSPKPLPPQEAEAQPAAPRDRAPSSQSPD
jgi:hypothetical protein